MKKLQSFDTFVNERSSFTKENSQRLNESAKDYITDPSIPDENAYKTSVLQNAGPALNKLLKRKGIDYNPITAVEKNGRIKFESKPITGKDLGFFQWGMKSAELDTFGGGKLEFKNSDEGFTFNPYIWFNLHYDYEHGAAHIDSRGSNGCEFFLPGERVSDIYYDVINKEFLTNSEAGKRKDWQ